MNKKIKILLISSLVVNVLLLGLVGGHIIKHKSKHGGFMRHAIEETAEKLPQKKAELLRATMGEADSANRELRKQMWEARQNVMDVLTAPEFDREIYRREVKHLHDLREQMMQRIVTATETVASQLTQEERKIMAENLRHEHRYKHKRKKWD